MTTIPYHSHSSEDPSATEQQSFVAKAHSSTTHGQPPPESFPAEIWALIIEENSSHREWLALSKTCRLFHQIAQPCLYKTINLRTMRNPYDGIVNRHVGFPHYLFERSFNKQPELGLFVCDLYFCIDYVPPKPRHSTPYTFMSKLYLFPNLQNLGVMKFRIDADLYRVIHSHPRLKVVKFNCCTLDSSLAAADLQQIPRCVISEVNISSPDYSVAFPEKTWGTLVPVTSLSLSVSAYVSASLSDLSLIFSGIEALGRNRMLETLSTNVLPRSLLRFLASSPQLRHLKIQRYNLSPAERLIFSSLPTYAIPFLEDYSGPAEFAEVLVPGRPVHVLHLTFHYAIPEDVRIGIILSLDRSSVPVRELRISTMFVGEWLWNLPVTISLLSFSLARDMDKAGFVKWLPAMRRLTNLRTVNSTTYVSRDNALQKEDIIQISETCPSLREVSIGEQRWIMDNKMTWDQR